MRKMLVSLEELREKEGDVLSMEEVAILTDDARREAEEANYELTEAERIIEVSDALEDLALIADGIEEATPAEVALIENAGSLIVAGTDVSPEEVIPSLSGGINEETGIATESFIGKKISTEGIREIANTLWDNIKKFLKGIWEKIESFLYKIIATIPRQRKEIQKLKEKIYDVEKSGAVQSKEKLTLTSGVNALCINDSPAASEAALKNGLNEIITVNKFVFGKYVDSVVKIGEVISEEIKQFKPKYGAANSGPVCAEQLNKALNRLSIADDGIFVRTDTRIVPGFKTKLSKPLLGNKSLVAKIYEGGDGHTEVLASLDRHRNTRVVVMRTPGTSMAHSKMEISPIAASGMINLLDDCLSILKSLEDYKTGPKVKMLLAEKRRIETASETATSEMKSVEAGNGKASDMPYYRSLLNYNTAYARWSKDPMVDVINHSIASVKAISFVVSKSLAAYGVVDKK